MITWTVEWIHGKSRERGIYPQRVCDLIKDEASIISIIHLIVCGLHGACKRTSCTTGGRSMPATSTYMQSFFYLNCITTTLERWPKCILAGSFPNADRLKLYHQSIQSSSLITKPRRIRTFFNHRIDFLVLFHISNIISLMPATRITGSTL